MPAQRVVLITGASSGVGPCTLRLLSQRGDKVFGTSRDPASDALQCAKGSPAARGRAAAVIRKSIGIPSQLSLQPLQCPALISSHDRQPAGRIENGTKIRTLDEGIEGR
jgi:NAD(P)-dependent dehydrogenase (short-subunit alcohol dehydrogenase family)